MNHASLYTGIGGWLLAAEMAGIENIFAVENDKFCNKVIKKNFPKVKQYGDIKKFKGKEYYKTIDILSSSDPCQPYSIAGKRKGSEDDRFLWEETIRVVQEIRPPVAVFENVAGLISMENGKALERILTDLENEGYWTEAFIIPAASVGAWHRRDRIWIIANSLCIGSGKIRSFIKDDIRRQNTNDIRQVCKNGSIKDVSNTKEAMCKQPRITRSRRNGLTNSCKDVPDTDNQELQGRNGRKLQKCRKQRIIRKGNTQNDGKYWQSEPELGRVANGIPNRVDRLKGLGNAIVPQVAFEIFKAILQTQK